MTALIIWLGVLTCWLVTARQLFRYWYRNDILKNDLGSGRKAPMSRGEVAAVAMAASVLFPLVPAVLFVMWKHPVSQREMQEKIGALEQENRRLSRKGES